MSSFQWCFDRFRLDPTNACLWCAEQELVLPPKAFDVLHYLVTHPDRLVTKDELLSAVWPETVVSDVVVRIAIGAVRTYRKFKRPFPLTAAPCVSPCR